MSRDIVRLLAALALAVTLASSSVASGAASATATPSGPAQIHQADLMMGPGCGASNS